MGALVTKECFKCGETKPLSDFYKHPRMADGHVNKCKECNKKDVHKNRKDNLEYVQEYDRNRRKKCNVSEERWEEISTKRSNYQKAYYEKYPEKLKLLREKYLKQNVPSDLWEARLAKARKANYAVDAWEVLSEEKKEWAEKYYSKNPDKWEEKLAKSRKASCTEDQWRLRLESKRKWDLENPERKAEVTKKYRENNPKKYKAHSMVGSAIKSGKLTPQPCSVCGAEKVHGHHPDYDKPLDVIWLCAEHHSEWHLLNGEGLNAT